MCASIAAGLRAVGMIPAAFPNRFAFGPTAYRSVGGLVAAACYFLGTSAMMGIAFATAVTTLFTICGESDC
jgi:hypothetical protein